MMNYVIFLNLRFSYTLSNNALLSMMISLDSYRNSKRLTTLCLVSIAAISIVFIITLVIGLAYFFNQAPLPKSKCPKPKDPKNPLAPPKDFVPTDDDGLATADFQHYTAKQIDNGWKKADPKNRWQGHVESPKDPSGTTTVAYNNYIGDKSKSKIGIMIAGNSGRPGGYCGRDGHVDNIKATYSTQEEDMISNWMITECGGGQKKHQKCMDDLYKTTINKKWGLTQPNGASTKTFQGIDYTSKSLKPWQYGDAWVVKGARLSLKRVSGKKKWYDTKRTFPADLFFVSGPNADKKSLKKGTSSSMKRTFNSIAADANHWNYFRSSLKAAMRGGLEAMRKNGIKFAYVALISAGIYAGVHSKRILAKGEFEKIVDEVCNEVMDATKKPRCAGFKRVISVRL